MRQLLKSKWLNLAMAIVGFGLLGGYLAITAEWHLSLAWALAVPAISLSVAWLLVGLKLFDRFPKLNGYLLYPSTEEQAGTALSRDEWAFRQAHYLDSMFRGKAILSAPAEDGLICVPVLIVGICPLSALVGGTVFGLMHLARFSYLECVGKGIYYTLILYFVLPHGLLTVVLGHLMMDGLAFVIIRVAKRKLSAKLRSNPTVDPDARESSARGSP